MMQSWDFWIWLWTILFLVGVLGFAAMSLWVAVAGVFDIKRMISELSRPESAAAEQEER